MREWIPSLGALYDGTATSFRVWAPDARSVDVVLEGCSSGPASIRPLTGDSQGYWSGRFGDVAPGVLYRYRLDAREDRIFADPASRFQPQGVHGPSEVVDPSRFGWTDRAWQPPALDGLVFYELHVGTFSEAGTYRGAIGHLPHLAALGVNAIELMPVGDFAGSRNWGYDGVAMFAPARCYGTPDDLRALVDAAHRHGLAVFVDAVYNHFGPDGAYATVFSAHYLTEAHKSPWGRGINLDGPHSREVRRFFLENAMHWVGEYHVDGLRLDATHALADDSPRHFLEELTATLRRHAERPVVIVAEDHRNLARMLLPLERGGYGLDGVWADDFHHQARVHTAGDREGYYADFSGSIEDLVSTIRQGWFFTGQHSEHMGGARGTDPSPLLPRQFIVCIQNHDQVGNRADGGRLNHEIDLPTYRALSALLLLVPQTPLLFMGQEWAATSPFLFFTDHHEELGRSITEGRRREFSGFAAFRGGDPAAAVPDPQDVETFARSRLRWDELSRPPHSHIVRLYQRLLALRRSPGTGRETTRDAYDASPLDGHSLVLSRRGAEGAGDTVLVVRLSGAGEVEVPAAPGNLTTALTTEDPDVAGDPLPIGIDRSAQGLRIRFARPGAMVFRQTS